MFCKNCGTELSEQVKFCPKCGAATGTAVKMVQPGNTYENVANNIIGNDNGDLRKPKVFRPVYLIIAGIVFALIFTLLGGMPKNPEKLILGQWYRDDDGTEIVFNDDGIGVIGHSGYFSWEIDSEKNLIIDFVYDDMERTWDASGKCEDSEQWYVDKNKLIMTGDAYYRTPEKAAAHREDKTWFNQ